MMHFSRLSLLLAAAVLSGCNLLGNLIGTKTPDYKGAQARTTQPLEVPPELTAPTMDERYAIPDPRAQTTYSAYARGAAGAAPAAARGSSVLPRFDSVRLERSGDQRWLVVKGEADKVWPVVREFWSGAGYTLVREQPEVGIMETEWSEERARVPGDMVRSTLGRLMGNMWSSARRDKFRTRLEKGAEAGTTEIFISNRAMEEVLNQSQDSSKWVPLPADRELEAEMLTRIQVKLGTGDTRVATAPRPGAAATPAGASAPSGPANAVLQNAGAGPLVVNDSFDRAWRRVGLALDRVGFTVEDRDRSKGLFFVRYIDPEADAPAAPKGEGGFLDKLAFWRGWGSKPKASSLPQYRIHVADAGASMSQVQVQNAQGTAESSSTGKKILTLLFEQLK